MHTSLNSKDLWNDILLSTEQPLNVDAIVIATLHTYSYRQKSAYSNGSASAEALDFVAHVLVYL